MEHHLNSFTVIPDQVLLESKLKRFVQGILMLSVDVPRQPPEFLDVSDLEMLVLASTLFVYQFFIRFQKKLQTLQTPANVPNEIKVSHTPEPHFKNHQSPSIAFESTSLHVLSLRPKLVVPVDFDNARRCKPCASKGDAKSGLCWLKKWH